MEAMNEVGILVTAAETGQSVDLGHGAWLRVV
jgi:hypothetical protein